MTTKTAEKAPPGHAPPDLEREDQMRAACQCHTLAQILYRQMAARYPWVVQASGMGWAYPMTGWLGVPPGRAGPGLGYYAMGWGA